MSGTNFTGCTVDYTKGSGGSLAIFDTEANIENCEFEGSQGTAVLFESSSPSGAHMLKVCTSNNKGERCCPVKHQRCCFVVNRSSYILRCTKNDHVTYSTSGDRPYASTADPSATITASHCCSAH